MDCINRRMTRESTGFRTVETVPSRFDSAQRDTIALSRCPAVPLSRRASTPLSETLLRCPAVPLLLVLIVLLFAVPAQTAAQTVMLPLRHPAYEYLDRIETRYGIGLVDFQRPLPRMDIARALDSLGRIHVLTSYDREQLAFYREEFAEELRRMYSTDSTVITPTEERWNLLHIRSATPARSYLAVDLVGRAGYTKRQDADDIIRRSNGIQAWGYVGPWLGAYMRWYDNGVSGITYDPLAFRTREQGVVRGPSSSATSYEYEVAEAQMWYSNPWLVAGVQKMDVQLGSGRDGAIIFSDKAPSVPMINYQIRITDWLYFEYFHAWLFSDILDTARTWAGQKFHETKYMASHSVTARILPNLQAALGESIVYGGGDVNVLFLIPVISFRAADRWTRFVSGNSQFFADVKYSPIQNLTLYGTGFIDEMDLSKALGGDRTNFDYHVAYTVGMRVTDAYARFVRLPSETRLEFSRVYPYVYSNSNPTQQYTSHKVLLGHWIGGNADLLTLVHTVHPVRWLEANLSLTLGRFARPYPSPLTVPRVQPAFLARPEFGLRVLGAGMRWMPLHDLYARFDVQHTAREEWADYLGSSWAPGLSFGVTASYGLY